MTGEPTVRHHTIHIGGMTCTGGARRLERELATLDGVAAVVVNFLTGDARITGDSDTLDLDAITHTVEALGYRVEGATLPSGVLGVDRHAIRRRGLLAWALAVPVIALMLLRWNGSWTAPHVHWLELVIASFSLALPGRSVLRMGLSALRSGTPNSDTLVAMASLLAFGTGIVSVFSEDVPGYAGIAALIVAMHGTGRAMEARARLRLLHGFEESSRCASSARAAQLSQPRIATFARQMGVFLVSVAMGSAGLTALFWLTIPDMMEALGGWAAAWLPWTPAGGASQMEMAVYAALAVLLVVGPCAFGLAAPAAVLVGTGVAAARGITIREGETIQRLRELTILAFSRTGTLTNVAPRVVAVEPADGLGIREVLPWAAAVALLGEHPIAHAIVDRAIRDRCPVFPVTDFEAEPGMGMRATVDGAVVRVGKAAWLAAAGVDTKPIAHDLYRMQQEGKTAVAVSCGRSAVGVVGLTDTMRRESVRAVKILKRMGIQCVLITGDTEETAAVLADQAGIERVMSEVLPGNKVQAIKRLREVTIRAVGIVGNGADDVGALAAADVGIVPGVGTGEFDGVGDVTLVEGDLMGVVTLTQLGKATYDTILQNIGMAFAYNLVALPLAMVGLIHPLMAIVLSALSVLAVLGNSRRLRHFDPETVTKEVLRR